MRWPFMLKSTYDEVIERARSDYLSLVERLHDAEDRHIQIEAKLREQIQDLAEQLATLRVDKGAVPERDRFEPKPEPPEPYSQALTEFLNGIEYEGARAMVEEDIERHRDQGLDDDFILQLISEDKDA